MITRKEQLLERLTGVHSSRQTYYVELKERVRETQLRNLQLQILNRLSRSIGVDALPEEILRTLESGLKSVLAFERLTLYVRDQNGVRARASLPAVEGADGAGGQGAAEVRLDPRVLEAMGGLHTLLDRDGGVLVPLRVGDNAVGLLEVVTAADRPLAEQDMDFLEQVAVQIAFGLQNSLLFGEVARARQAWEDTFAAVTDVLYVLGSDLAIRQANQAARALFDRNDLVGRRCHALLFGRSDPCPDCPAVRAMRGREPAYQQIRVENRTMDVYTYPLARTGAADADGGAGEDAVGAVVYAKDVTELVRSARFVALGEMAAGVAHELNGPLTAIVGDAQILLRDARRGEAPGPTVELLRDIENSGLRARGIIQNLLAFSQKEQFTFEPVNLNEVARHGLSRVAYQIEKDGINVELDLADPPPVVMGHSPRLEQIVINLLLNARDAMTGREKRSIFVATRGLPTQEAALEIRDTGVGIPPEDLTRIFTPFFTTKPVGQGTGLGLSVSLGIAAAHGGRIEVQSAPGAGAAFSLILPARREESLDPEDSLS
ncbi:MAG: hypothetical protein A2Y96_02640 [Firmicutes bacterium RBG_13_65_8]|nr:MAG: hypothetical protein A2Y96_02640 [Firmicutes bacterium RBG_13_65_8]